MTEKLDDVELAAELIKTDGGVRISGGFILDYREQTIRHDSSAGDGSTVAEFYSAVKDRLDDVDVIDLEDPIWYSSTPVGTRKDCIQLVNGWGLSGSALEHFRDGTITDGRGNTFSTTMKMVKNP